MNVTPNLLTIKTVKLCPALLLFYAFILLTNGCSGKPGDNPEAKTVSEKTNTLSDEPLAGFRDELLTLSFETATRIPVEPHIKDRSRAQEAVVTACLELDQPARALAYIEKIDDWRRGFGYAELAFYLARRGFAEEAANYLQLAEEVSKNTEDWRRDRIRVQIAKTYTVLGNTAKAEEFEAGVVDSEVGKVAGIRAMVSEEVDFDAQIQALDPLLAQENFDFLKNALGSCAQLYNRFYDDEAKRERVEEKILSSWRLLPIMYRMELLIELAGFALDHADQEKAMELVNESQRLLNEHQWHLEYYIPLAAKIAGLRHRAGDKEKAKADADAALTLFNKDKQAIVNIWRAGALRPLAEAYQSMGETEAALNVYKTAIEEGYENPNSRPRAEDLSATCSSMALHAAEPDEELWTRIRQINQGLGEPW